MFFVVDVETTSTNPMTGELISIGACATDGHKIDSQFYMRIKFEKWDENTREWWLREPCDEAKQEVFDVGLERAEPYEALAAFNHWLFAYNAPRFFVANPVSFDKPWVDNWFTQHGLDSPFHYRSLCLRSMKFGLRRDSTFDSERDNHTPEIPHHALYDAIAQTYDLHSMLRERDAATPDLSRATIREMLKELQKRGASEQVHVREATELLNGSTQILQLFPNDFLDAHY